jgi:Icc protein
MPMSNFSFIQITDHHLGVSHHSLRKGFLLAYGFLAVLRDIAERWNDVDFIVSTGDIASGGTLEEYENVCRMLDLKQVSRPPGPQLISLPGGREIPMYFIPGNHDDRKQFCLGLFGYECDANLLHLSFNHKDVQFVAPDWGPEEPDGTKPATRYYRFVDGGGTAPDTTDQLAEWLVCNIRDGEPAVLLTHYAPLIVENVWDERQVPRNIEKFWKVISTKRNILAILCGHIHQTFETSRHGIPVLGLAATCFQHILHDGEYVRAILPPAYRRVVVEGRTLRSSVHTVELPTDGAVADFLPH